VRIESVRSLKQEIRETVLAPLISQDLDRRRLGVRAIRLDRPVRPKTAALGIATANAGSGEYKLAVRVQHPLLWDGPEIRSIHDKACGEIDLRYIGSVRPLQARWYQEECRPLRIGSSVGHYQITAGTLGAFVQDRTTGAIQVLSNNHVLAAENQGRPGDDILQPGKYDNGQDPKDTAANLTRFVPIDFAGINTVDGAVATLAAGIRFDAQSLDSRGSLSGGRTAPFSGPENVYKIGRTTGITKGVVQAVEVDNVSVSYDQGSAIFDSQIEIQGPTGGPFAAGGDSGSLVVDENNLAFGLLFGGTLQEGPNNAGLVYVNHLDSVLNQLNVDLLW
jgi:hypothetical protein